MTNDTAVLIIAICAAVVAAGLVLVARHSRPAPPALPLARYVAVCLAAGLGAGLIAAGAGGRLVMRLLAITSPDADLALTEAGARIGEITLGGTLGFVVFTGVPAGLLIGVLYALAGALLPPGRAGGLLLGAILLVLVGFAEPLRAENFDFDLVGPDWLSVLAFTALALFQGLLVVALAARLSRGVPSLEPDLRVLLVGRLALAAAVLVSLPFFAGDVADILQA
ncbi:MAG TPA: hypothetical protein VFN44_08390 [Solirubrobacteraceae bacterium]|nr:hypothetical protein [Solirubrobacteraceae bacterium]